VKGIGVVIEGRGEKVKRGGEKKEKFRIGSERGG